VHLKKSEKIIDDVSSGPVCAPVSKKDTTILYSGRFATGKRELFPPPHALAIPADGTGELGLPFARPVSPTFGRQVIRQNSGSFSPKAVSFSSSPRLPTAGIKDSVTFFPTPASPHTSKPEIFSKTPKVDSPKVRSNTKLAEDVITEDQDESVTGFPQKVEIQACIPLSPANTEPSDFEEPTVSHPYADSTSLYYSSTNAEEDEFLERGSGSSADVNEGTPTGQEVLFMEPSPTDTHLSGNEEYRDHDISSDKADDWLPIVMSQKTKISDERLKRILRFFPFILNLFMFPQIALC
jgi:nuclear mRNA export protein SAC3